MAEKFLKLVDSLQAKLQQYTAIKLSWWIAYLCMHVQYVIYTCNTVSLTLHAQPAVTCL